MKLQQKNFQMREKDMEIQVQEIFKSLNKYCQKRIPTYHITINIARLKSKGRLLEVTRENTNSHAKGYT
jgi:hypothetical protein